MITRAELETQIRTFINTHPGITEVSTALERKELGQACFSIYKYYIEKPQAQLPKSEEAERTKWLMLSAKQHHYQAMKLLSFEDAIEGDLSHKPVIIKLIADEYRSLGKLATAIILYLKSWHAAEQYSDALREEKIDKNKFQEQVVTDIKSIESQIPSEQKLVVLPTITFSLNYIEHYQKQKYDYNVANSMHEALTCIRMRMAPEILIPTRSLLFFEDLFKPLLIDFIATESATTNKVALVEKLLSLNPDLHSAHLKHLEFLLEEKPKNIARLTKLFTCIKDSKETIEFKSNVYMQITNTPSVSLEQKFNLSKYGRFTLEAENRKRETVFLFTFWSTAYLHEPLWNHIEKLCKFITDPTLVEHAEEIVKDFALKSSSEQALSYLEALTKNIETPDYFHELMTNRLIEKWQSDSCFTKYLCLLRFYQLMRRSKFNNEKPDTFNQLSYEQLIEVITYACLLLALKDTNHFINVAWQIALGRLLTTYKDRITQDHPLLTFLDIIKAFRSENSKELIKFIKAGEPLALFFSAPKKIEDYQKILTHDEYKKPTVIPTEFLSYMRAHSLAAIKAQENSTDKTIQQSARTALLMFQMAEAKERKTSQKISKGPTRA